MASLDRFRSVDLKLDKANEYYIETQFAKEGDYNGRELVVQITNGGEVTDQTGVSLNLGWQHQTVKNQGLDPFEVVHAATGIFKISYPAEMMKPGKVTAVIQVVENGKITHTRNFTIQVEASPIDESTIVSENSFAVLQEALIKVNEWDGEFEKKYNRLEEEYAEQLSGVSTQLTETQKRDFTRNTVESTGITVGDKQPKEPLVTFIDDDGAMDVYTRLKPIFESRGVPLTVAIVSDWAKNGNPDTAREYMRKEQLMELQSMGWEIASHEKTHMGLGNIVDEKILYDELIQSKIDLLEMGLDVKNLVYPFGQQNERVQSVASTVYKVATRTPNASNNQTNKAPLDNFSLARVALGSYGATENVDTLEHHKSVIDKAIAEGSWVIFMTHVWAQQEDKDRLIADVIDYTLSRGVRIVNLDEGLNVFGDKLSVGENLRIGPSGDFHSDKLVFVEKDDLLTDPAKAADLDFMRNNYGFGKIIRTPIVTAYSAGFPKNTPGILTTYLESEDIYTFQTYRIYRTGETVFRAWDGSTFTSWKHNTSSFSDVTSENNDNVPANSTIEVKIPCEGITRKDKVVVNHSYRPSHGIVYTANAGAGEIVLTLSNLTNSDKKPNASPWRFKVFKNFEI